MNAHVNAIGNRLSLRHPQRESLSLLARVADLIKLDKGADPVAALAILHEEFSSVEDFEREFPSLCFALATGVGKTRLMGAFITYLFRAKGIRHFFVLAPNLTIYNKLIADFTPNTPSRRATAARSVCGSPQYSTVRVRADRPATPRLATVARSRVAPRRRPRRRRTGEIV